MSIHCPSEEWLGLKLWPFVFLDDHFQGARSSANLFLGFLFFSMTIFLCR
jgi:hypothetical protein